MHPGARLSKKFPGVEAMKSKTYMPLQESTPTHWESIIADLTAKTTALPPLYVPISVGVSPKRALHEFLEREPRIADC
jgi:hypothetical protein